MMGMRLLNAGLFLAGALVVLSGIETAVIDGVPGYGLILVGFLLTRT